MPRVAAGGQGAIRALRFAGMNEPLLVIGTKTVSSWSLRPWIALVAAGIPFRERVLPLRRSDTGAQIAAWSPSRKVPVLVDGASRIWESYAILEHLADRYPDRRLWPVDPVQRGWARSIACEMHNGFAGLRREMPMDTQRKYPQARWSDATQADIERIQAIWRETRTRFGGDGPFLFGTFSNADAMYAPVVTRFDTYPVALDRTGRAYVAAVMKHPAMQRWYREAAAEHPATDGVP